MSADWKLNLKFEYKGRDTPQINNLSEVLFHAIANWSWVTMNKANVLKN
jgi:hypothetical protein